MFLYIANKLRFRKKSAKIKVSILHWTELTEFLKYIKKKKTSIVELIESILGKSNSMGKILSRL